MKKKKETQKKAIKPKKPKAAEPVLVEEPEVPESAPTGTLPSYENAQVIQILQENTPEGFHHCKMSDGTTKHVPVGLF